MTPELVKRIFYSFVLVVIFLFSFLIHKYLFLILLFSVFSLSWYEWINLIKKVKFKSKAIENLSFLTSFFYLLFIGFFIYEAYNADKILLLVLLTVCIFSDIGGYCFGKIIGGKKLTKISPNKTISGSIGSFLFSLIFFNFYFFLANDTYSTFNIMFIIIPIFLSFICQTGDLFISYFKRKAKIKDTSKLIPGHGGILDRIDGIIFALPIAIYISPVIF